MGYKRTGKPIGRPPLTEEQKLLRRGPKKYPTVRPDPLADPGHPTRPPFGDAPLSAPGHPGHWNGYTYIDFLGRFFDPSRGYGPNGYVKDVLGGEMPPYDDLTGRRVTDATNLRLLFSQD